MARIRVLAPGLLTTLQDLGRPGYGREGVAVSGAADGFSLRIANRLLGNPEGAAALEMTLLGGRFLFEEKALVALAGSDFGAVLERRGGEGSGSLAPWSSFLVGAGDVLRLGPSRSGARAYLAVRGGFAVQPFLGSAATHLPSGLGGHEGRALRAGDVLEIGPAEGPAPVARSLDPSEAEALLFRSTLRVVPGPQAEWFGDEVHVAFLGSEFVVDESSDRTGIRLTGPALAAKGACTLLTEGVVPGQVQATPDGRAIVLFVDGPTTGGYPKIASVIAADLPALGQARPRDRVRFASVTLEEARGAWSSVLELSALSA